MNKKLQLKILVVICMIIVIIVYLYLSKGFSFGLEEDFDDLKDSVVVNINELSESTIVKDIKEKFNDLKEEAEVKEENIKSEITKKVLNQLSLDENIIYEYEPWNIKFSYSDLMTKELNQNNEKITLFYKDIEGVRALIEKYNLEVSFNDWLNNNYDLQSLNKLEYNDLVFWMQDLSNQENRLEEYYVNLENNIFIISLESVKEKEESYWGSLETIIKSFNPINI